MRTERALSNFCPEMTERELEYWFMDFRMNQRGVNLDQRAAREAVELCRREVERLDNEMYELTGGRVPGGSKRIAFKGWANEQVVTLNSAGCKMTLIPDTRADTLSFALHGVPTKAAEEAKAARKPEMDKLWESRGLVGATLKKAMEICLEVNRSSVAKFRTMNAAVCSATTFSPVSRTAACMTSCSTTAPTARSAAMQRFLRRKDGHGLTSGMTEFKSRNGNT